MSSARPATRVVLRCAALLLLLLFPSSLTLSSVVQGKIGTFPLRFFGTRASKALNPRFQKVPATIRSDFPAPGSGWGFGHQLSSLIKRPSFRFSSYLPTSFSQNLLLCSNIRSSGKKTEPARTLASLCFSPSILLGCLIKSLPDCQSKTAFLESSAKSKINVNEVW